MPERIWAPWRMEYIKSDAEASGCVLCGYAGMEPKRENGVLVSWARTYVVLNKYPYAAGHLMVAPNAHVEALDGLADEEHTELFRLVRASAVALREATGAQGLNIGINLGRPAGAGIDQHLHVHLVPRWIGDHNFMPVLGDTRVLPELLEGTWDRLWPRFSGLQGGAP